MHGVIHQNFKEYVLDNYSEPDFEAIMSKSGYKESDFKEDEYYKDDDFNAILKAAQDQLSKGRENILFEFGVQLTPGLFKTFAGFIEDGWKTFDFIEAVEGRMHKYVREEMGAYPPALKTERVSDDELKVNFISHRDMWGLAKGFITGISRRYGETFTIDIEHNGREHTFTIRRAI